MRCAQRLDSRLQSAVSRFVGGKRIAIVAASDPPPDAQLSVPVVDLDGPQWTGSSQAAAACSAPLSSGANDDAAVQVGLRVIAPRGGHREDLRFPELNRQLARQ